MLIAFNVFSRSSSTGFNLPAAKSEPTNNNDEDDDENLIPSV